MRNFVPADETEMAFDHVAYLVRDTDASLAALAHMAPRISIYREPLDSQKAYITILTVGRSGQKLELVEPYPDNSVIQSRLDREGQDSVLYHICYNVTDFDRAFRDMRRNGWMPLTMPFEGLLPGCRASHLYNPVFGVIEIAEVSAL